MNDKELIEKSAEHVKKTLQGAEGGHDWWHTYRVWKIAERIGKEEKTNMLIVELGALFHDIADAKFHNGDETIGAKKTRDFLESMKVDEIIITKVEEIVNNISFHKEFGKKAKKSKELCVVQDADRLDAIGAIGIARAFNYGGHANRPLYDPDTKPNANMTKEYYVSKQGNTINHFYEKLLLLKDKMNTKTGKQLAEHRHKILEDYLKEFFDEWEGKK